MIPLATAEEMRRADRRALDVLGLPGLVLMENAGRGAADVLERALGPVRGRRVAVVCGKGNNGGDGLVVARHLAGRGARVDVWLMTSAAELRGDAGTNLAVARAVGLEVQEVGEGPGAPGLQGLARHLAEADLVVDALLGTGVSGEVTGPTARGIDAINRAGRPVCALDLPSGLSADNGRCLGSTVRARLTVTFGLAKRGLYLGSGPAHAGRVEVVDLGVPRAWLAEGIRVGILERDDVRAVLPDRPRDAHKGHFGHLLVVAGSRGKTGAAVLACRGALRTGAGLVTCAVPASQQPVVAAALPEAMTEPLAETGSGTLSGQALDRLADLIGRVDALALGPGVGLEPETQDAVRMLVRAAPRPVAIDADALTALAGDLAALGGSPAPRLLTPHPGEAGRLLGRTAGEVQADRIGSALRLAEMTGAVVALKGAGTLVVGPDGAVALNPTGNAGMATAGMGDVLTGVAGALLAAGLGPRDALRTAVYLHGLAGDRVVRVRGPAGLLASEVADALPGALGEVSGEAV